MPRIYLNTNLTKLHKNKNKEAKRNTYKIKQNSHRF